MNHGAVMRSWRKAAMKVMVCQRPCGTLALMRCPRGAQPRSGAILVLVQVSSMNTSRVGIDPISILGPLRPPTGDVGTVLLGANQLPFFITELLSVDELPHRAVIDLEATLSQFGHQPSHGKILPATLHPAIRGAAP